MELREEHHRALAVILDSDINYDIFEKRFFKNYPESQVERSGWVFRHVVRYLEDGKYLSLEFGGRLPEGIPGIYRIDPEKKVVSLNVASLKSLWIAFLQKYADTIGSPQDDNFFDKARTLLDRVFLYRNRFFSYELISTMFFSPEIPLRLNICGVINIVLYYILISNLVRTEYVFYNEKTRRETAKIKFSERDISDNGRFLFKSSIWNRLPENKKNKSLQISLDIAEERFYRYFKYITAEFDEETLFELQLLIATLFDSFIPYTHEKRNNVEDWMHLFRFSRLLARGFPRYISDKELEEITGIDRNRIFIPLKDIVIYTELLGNIGRLFMW